MHFLWLLGPDLSSVWGHICTETQSGVFRYEDFRKRPRVVSRFTAFDPMPLVSVHAVPFIQCQIGTAWQLDHFCRNIPLLICFSKL